MIHIFRIEIHMQTDPNRRKATPFCSDMNCGLSGGNDIFFLNIISYLCFSYPNNNNLAVVAVTAGTCLSAIDKHAINV